MNERMTLLEVVQKDIKYLIEAKGGKEWEFYHIIDLYQSNDNWYHLMYDGILVCYGPIEEINAVIKAWCRIADIEGGKFDD